MMLLLLLCQQDADTLLKQLEAKLVKAKTLQVEIKGETSFTKGGKKATASMAGVIKAKAPAKYSFIGTMSQGEQKIEANLVSDGATVKETAGDKTRTMTPVKDFSERAGALFSRFGFVPAQVLGLRNEDLDPQVEGADFLPDARKLVTIEAAKAAVDGGVTTITGTAVYRRYAETSDTKVAFTLVLGADGFPAKRTLKHVMEAITVEVVETYSNWKLDADIADDEFKVK